MNTNNATIGCAVLMVAAINVSFFVGAVALAAYVVKLVIS